MRSPPAAATACDDAQVASDFVPQGMTQPAAKAEWRMRLLTARRERSGADRAAAQAAITEHLLAALTTLGGGRRLTVCLYLPLPSEPLAADAPLLVAHRGHRVLVPVTTMGEPLNWCDLPGGGGGVGAEKGAGEHDAALVPGLLGVPEPSGPRLGAGAILTADVIVVPALATDPSGFRLGRGGGFYDRSLALLPGSAPRAEQATGTGPAEGGVTPDSASAAPGATAEVPRIAVLFDGETDLPLPHSAHDARVSHVITPAGGLRAIALRAIA